MAQVASALKGRPPVRDDVDRLRQRIDALRGDIGSDVYELESRVRQAFDLRHQVARHPVVAAVVVLGGLFVATRIVQSTLRGVRTFRAKGPSGKRGRRTRAIAEGPGRGPGTREACLEEVRG
jgi:hypothetical protein